MRASPMDGLWSCVAGSHVWLVGSLCLVGHVCGWWAIYVLVGHIWLVGHMWLVAHVWLLATCVW